MKIIIRNKRLLIREKQKKEGAPGIKKKPEKGLLPLFLFWVPIAKNL